MNLQSPRSLSLLLLLVLAGCPVPKPGPGPTPTPSPTPKEKALVVSKAQAPSQSAIDFKSSGQMGYVLYKNGNQLSLQTIDQNHVFSSPQVITNSCDSNHSLFVTPKLAATSQEVYVAWGRMTKTPSGIRLLKSQAGSQSWATLPNVLSSFAVEFFNIESDPQGNVYLASFDTTNEELKVTSTDGTILAKMKNPSKTFRTSSDAQGANFFGRFTRLVSLTVNNSKVTRTETPALYVSEPQGIYSQALGSYVISGWSDYYQVGQDYFPKVLSIVTSHGKQDLFSLSLDDAKTAYPVACPIEVGMKRGEAYIVQGHLWLELDGKKDLGPASELLCRAYGPERTEILTPGMLYSIEWK